MKELVVFITSHWILASLLGVLVFAFILNEIIGSHFGSRHTVLAEHAVQMINHQNAVVFDIRTETEFSTGHIVGAEQLTAATLDKKMPHLAKYLQQPIIIGTTNGQDTTKMMTLLREKGFSRIFILSGGMQNWKSAGMPMVKS